MRRILVLALLCALSITAFAQQQSKPRPQPQTARTTHAESTPELRQQTFEKVWTTVKEKHFDPTFGGVDWDKIRSLYEPKVTAVKGDQELYILLQQMLGELKQSHFNIIPPDAVITDETTASDPALGNIGIDLRIVEDKVMVTRVDADSNAARAGLKTGFIITKVDDFNVESLRERLSHNKEAKETAAINRIYLTRAVMARIDGAPQTNVRVSVLNHKNQPQEFTIERQRAKGELSPRFGNFPPTYLEFESKRLLNNIGYIRFNIFLMPVMEKIRPVIRSMTDAPGIIIDLRGNPGGLGGMSSGIAGMLTAQELKLGSMRMRSGYLNFIGYPQEGAFLGPVVILIDGTSASTSEVFASGMQETGRAVVIGERSAGAALPSIIEKLPTGALFQYATADFKTPKGVLIEGRGVLPDIEIKLQRSLLFDGRDPQLDAAIEQIQKMSTQKTVSSAK